MARVWQQPFLNVFRHFKVDEWKRSTKEGDVAAVTDKTLKCTVYRVRGSVSASNYIQLPKTSTQSLGLTGRYLYVLFRPLPTKHFVIHLDVSTEDSQVIRVSFSNLFKEFKSTATWLQFPFICEAGTPREGTVQMRHEWDTGMVWERRRVRRLRGRSGWGPRGCGRETGNRPRTQCCGLVGERVGADFGTSPAYLPGVASPGARWTCLQLDLHDILLVYLHRCYSHLKGVRLCASMLVRNLYTSDLCFNPAITVAEARRAKLPVTPMPREMAFPVPKGESWHDRYVHIRFPSGSSHVPSKLVQKSGFPPEAVLVGHVPRLLPSPVACSKPARDSRALVVQKHDPAASRWAPSMPRPLPEVSMSCERSEVSHVAGPGGCIQEPSAWAEATDEHAAGDGLHVSAGQPTVEPAAPEDAAPHESPGRKQSLPEAALGKKRFQQRSFLPDPILRLKGVIGFGGHSTKWALWTPDGAAVVYPCHAVVVVLHVETREQRLFLGHTDKVSALALDGSGLLLASAQARPHSMLRLWDFQTGSCLALFRSPVHTICSLSFSNSGELLCGVGKDRHGRTTVLVWGVAQLGRGGEAIILAQAHSDADVQVFRVAFFDEASSFSLESAEALVEHRCHRGAITSLAASPDGRFLFSACSRGALAQYHSGAPRCRVLRVAANVVCQEACPSSSIMVVSRDSRLLAFVGPSKYTVSVVDTASLDELLKVDVSALDLAGSCLDSAVALCFGPSPPSHLLVSTSSNTITVLDARSGRVVRQLSCGHPAACASLALSADGRFLLTAAERAVRLWDYATQAGLSCQVYIGHSEPVQAVAFIPNQQQLLSVGDAIFLWDILVPREGWSPGSVQGAPRPPLTCEAGPGAGELDGVASGARAPPQQVSVSPPALPPEPGLCAEPPEGFDGALFLSDESHGPEDLHQASGPSVLVQKEAGRADDGACGVTGGPWDLGRRPHPCGWPRACSTVGARARTLARPDSYRHFTARYK
ncbi:PREDICTED: WD repeat-containing protein 90-like, partial [Bison bison bison]|uniref:WD repeat-containing protein 90-like n=1 Tax=Bison bison bison TaxID=43346 RepID=A0A6P3HH65_BISBB